MADFEGKYSPFSGGGGGAGGTVTSVDCTVPASILSVSGVPIVDAGTIAIDLVTQNANKVWAGPTTGADANPTFRALVAADIPSLSSVYLPLAGGTMAGAIAMATNNVTGAGTMSSGIFSSTTSNPAGAGLLRAANNESLAWRDSSNAANATFLFNSSNQFVLNYSANRMVVDGTGPVSVNAAIDTIKAFRVGAGGTTATSGITGVAQIGISSELVSSSSATSATYGFYSAPSTANASYTCAARYSFYSDVATKGASSTITRDIGYYVNLPNQGTNNASIADNLAFTGSWFINSNNSTVPSLFSGVNFGGISSNKIIVNTASLAGTATAIELVAGASSAAATVGANLRLGGGAGGSGAEKGVVVILGTANSTGQRPCLVSETDGVGEFGYNYAGGAYARFRAGFLKTSLEVRDSGGSSSGILLFQDGSNSRVSFFRSTAGHGLRLENTGDRILQIQDESANVLFQFSNGNFITGTGTSNVVRFNNATQTTVGAAGAASALPATPSGYIEFNINGTAYVLPYYAKS